MTLQAIGMAILWAALTFTAICAAVGLIAFFIGGFLVYVAEREFRHTHRKQRKDAPK